MWPGTSGHADPLVDGQPLSTLLSLARTVVLWELGVLTDLDTTRVQGSDAGLVRTSCPRSTAAGYKYCTRCITVPNFALAWVAQRLPCRTNLSRPRRRTKVFRWHSSAATRDRSWTASRDSSTASMAPFVLLPGIECPSNISVAASNVNRNVSAY